MTTFADILAFVKSQARITTTSEDENLGYLINQSYLSFCRSNQWPGLRKTASFSATGGTQNYILASDFDRLILDGVRYYTTGSTDYKILPVEIQPDAEIWDAMQATYDPLACCVVPDTTSGTQRKMRLLPNFTATGKTVEYAYYKKPAALSGSVVLELPELCPAIAWDVLASNKDFARDTDTSQAVYLERARRAKYAAISLTLP